MGRSARKRWSEHFDLGRMAREVESVYAEALSSGY
jgi:hypothetical protein